jgi:hypothetical protein
MRKILWAIETGIEKEYEQKLTQSAKDAGFDVVHPKFQPFVHDFRVDRAADDADVVIFHGSLQGAEVAKAYGWTVYENAAQLMCNYYYPRLHDRILNRQHVFMPFGDLKHHKDFLFRALGSSGCLFIRPDSNRKLFTGKVVTEETWGQDLELLGFYDDVVKPETMVVVAPPRNVDTEWRFFVSRGKVVTGSMYVWGRDHTRTLASENEIKRAQQYVDYCTEQGFGPDPVWVMDMCRTTDKQFHILEVGSFSSSGLYACDTDALVKAVIDTLDI